jgi:hypothetical protein
MRLTIVGVLLVVGDSAMGEIKLWDANHHYTRKFYGIHETTWKVHAD